MMHVTHRRPLLLLKYFIACVVVCSATAQVWAEDEFLLSPFDSSSESRIGFFRADKAEIFVVLQGSLSTDDEMGEDSEFVSVRFDETIQGGLGLGYNVTDQFNLNLEASAGKIDFIISAFGFDFPTEVTVATFLVNGEYAILKTPVTPLIVGSIGLMHLAEGVNDDNLFLSQTGFAYGLGGGVRWDVNDRLFLKLLYRSLWVDFDFLEDAARFDLLGLYMGMTF